MTSFSFVSLKLRNVYIFKAYQAFKIMINKIDHCANKNISQLRVRRASVVSKDDQLITRMALSLYKVY